MGLGRNYTTAWGNIYLKDFWEFDPSSSTPWSPLPDLPIQGRSGAFSFVIGNKGYLGHGITEDSNDNNRSLMEFDPASLSWNFRRFPPEYFRNGTSFGVNGRGFLGTDSRNDGVESHFFQYLPELDRWFPIEDIPVGRVGAVSFVVGDFAYVGGGSDGVDPLYDLWRYIPPR